MAGQMFPKTLKALMYIQYAVAVSVILFIGGRYILRLGDPPEPPAQGAEVASLRGFAIFLIDYPLDSRTSERIYAFSDGRISRGLVIDRVEERTNVATIRPALLAAAEQLQQTWCKQTSLPPTPSPTVKAYRLYLTCTTLTGRVFYFAEDQLPPMLVDVLKEAPPLAPRRAQSSGYGGAGRTRQCS
jgi:hypothetical protein